jgi:regulator of replication initiation timing
MKKKDIVVRLRQTGGLDDKLLKEAAEAIEALRKQSGTLAEHTYRLRNENHRLIAQRDEASKNATDWRDSAVRGLKERRAAEDERDDARRMYCRGFTDFCPNPAHAKLTLEQAAMQVAKELGWDCFKRRTRRVCDAYTK